MIGNYPMKGFTLDGCKSKVLMEEFDDESRSFCLQNFNLLILVPSSPGSSDASKLGHFS